MGMSQFYKYFKENTEALHLSAPNELFSTQDKAIGAAYTITKAIDLFGPKVTVRELIGAGILSEKLGIVVSISAAYYLGAVIGSIAVAIGRTLSGGVTIADVLYVANEHNLNRPWLQDAILKGR
jgi:hypothetical protein